MSVIRRARNGEASLLSELALQSKSHWGYDNEFIDLCRQELTYSDEQLNAHHAYVAELGSDIVGFYFLVIQCARECELEALFVRPKFIGQGHGRQLLNHAKNVAKECGMETMRIQGDPHAERFYLAAGAKQIGRKASSSIEGRSLPLFSIAIAADKETTASSD